jgi:recombinational DNA repair ATPase RecF
MRIVRLNLEAYGRCRNVAIEIGNQLTVVVGPNEAGKSTALDALSDLFWGIPQKSPRASDFTRPQLRIGAALDVGGQIRTFTRKSTGLFEQDLVTQVSAPWDSDNSLGRDWWRTRLGINHDDLRKAGRDAFAGDGDLAEIIFAAREGRSAKGILDEITARIDKLYKQHAGAKSVLLRVAEKNYKTAREELQTKLTSANKVVEQRVLVKSLETQHREAVAARIQASRGLKTALEDQRIIEAVLRLNQARSEVAKITAEGDRLSPSELAEWLTAEEALAEAATDIERLDATIRSKSQAIEALSINDRLLDDKATIERLQPETQARIDDLRRADEEFGPAAAAETVRLQELLRSIGIDNTDELDEALVNAGIRADRAATLDDLAQRIEDLEERRRKAQEKRDNSLVDLSRKGITFDLTTAKIPREEIIPGLTEELTTARDKASTAQALLNTARQETNALRSSAPTPVEPPLLNHADVIAARQDRDECWQAVQRSWLNGDLPKPEDRHDMATALDKAMREADQAADDEAVERSRVATQDALVGAHVEGLGAAKDKETAAHKELVEVTRECARLETEWNAVWSAMGVRPAPGTATSSAISGLIITAHAADQEDSSLAQQLAELAESWSRAAESVGLSAADTAAAWRKQSEVLEQIRSVQEKRAEHIMRGADARRRWETFAKEAVALLIRHGVAGDGQPISPVQVEQGLSRLNREVGETAEAAAKRTAYGEQIDEQSGLRAKAQQALQEASEALRRLADAHGLGSAEDLSDLVERARRAADPLAREAQFHNDIQINLDGGSHPATAIERLTGRDQVSVDQDVEEAEACERDAQDAADQLLSELATAKTTLTQLEDASSAAEAEADVASHQAELARLTEEWAILTLQKKLLTKALEALGSSDVSPLLDHAGRILDELTEGRWVALQAEDDGLTRKLSVIRGDAEKFGTSDLSEGTADQAFFALRLAAVAELHNERRTAQKPALPLVLDDILMTFDEQRTDIAIKVLAHLAPGLQVIVFTHHQFVADAAAQCDWATVSRLPAPSPIDATVDGEQLRAILQGVGLSGTGDRNYT